MDNEIPIDYKLTIDGDKLKGKGAAEFGGQKQEFDIDGEAGEEGQVAVNGSGGATLEICSAGSRFGGVLSAECQAAAEPAAADDRGCIILPSDITVSAAKHRDGSWCALSRRKTSSELPDPSFSVIALGALRFLLTRPHAIARACAIFMSQRSMHGKILWGRANTTGRAFCPIARLN